jgi:hypothetical protein
MGLFARCFRRAQALLTLALLLCLPLPSPAQHAAELPDALGATLREAFVYAYPYYEFMWLRDQALHDPQSLTYTQLNRFRHQRHLATPSDRWANGPIRDTFYSTAWVDLGPAPVLLSLPDTADRYYVLVLVAAGLLVSLLRPPQQRRRPYGRRSGRLNGAIPQADGWCVHRRATLPEPARAGARRAICRRARGAGRQSLRQQPPRPWPWPQLRRSADQCAQRRSPDRPDREAINAQSAAGRRGGALERFRESALRQGCRFADLPPDIQQRGARWCRRWSRASRPRSTPTSRA